MAAARAPKSLTRDDHARADHRAHRNQIAHREVGVVRRAQIADRGHAAFERALRVVLREEDRHGGPPPLPERACRRLPVPVVRHVRMQVDETRQARIAAQIDDLRAGRNVLRAGPDNDHAPRFDDHNGVDDCR